MRPVPALSSSTRPSCLTAAALVGAATALALTPACADEAAPANGRYHGDHVAFVLEGGVASDVALVGITCDVPYVGEDGQDFGLSICDLTAAAPPTATLTLRGQRLSGVVGDVELSGSFSGDGRSVSGRWTFTRSECFPGHDCRSEGTWEASWTAPLDPPAGAGDAGSSPDVAVPDGGGSGPGPVGGPARIPDDATADQAEAGQTLHDLRASVGVAPAELRGDLSAAAQAHADYFALHAAAYQQSGLNPHRQNSEWEDGFVGESFLDRLLAFGVPVTGGASEVMAFSGSVQGAIDGWMDTLYHRVPLIHPNTVAWGFGMVSGGGAACEVGDLLFGDAAIATEALWPLDGATGVDRSWDGYESPQPPLPSGASYPSGPIITLTFPLAWSQSLGEALLEGPGGVVPAQVQHPGNDPHLSETWSIYALSPLQPGTTYAVTMRGMVDGAAYERSWSFTTGQ